MPGMPLMPGVIMCEAAAQLSSYYAVKNKLMDGMMGFGGMEDIRFRGLVRPGDRFVIVTRLLKARRTIITCEFQSFRRSEPRLRRPHQGDSLAGQSVDQRGSGR